MDKIKNVIVNSKEITIVLNDDTEIKGTADIALKAFLNFNKMQTALKTRQEEKTSKILNEIENAILKLIEEKADISLKTIVFKLTENNIKISEVAIRKNKNYRKLLEKYKIIKKQTKTENVKKRILSAAKKIEKEKVAKNLLKSQQSLFEEQK